MQYIIEPNGVQPCGKERALIDVRIGLALSRFNSIIANTHIQFSQADSQVGQNLCSCSVRVQLKNNTDFVITDTGINIETSFSSAISRMKRTIERHLKRNSNARSSNSANLRL